MTASPNVPALLHECPYASAHIERAKGPAPGILRRCRELGRIALAGRPPENLALGTDAAMVMGTGSSAPDQIELLQSSPCHGLSSSVPRPARIGGDPSETRTPRSEPAVAWAESAGFRFWPASARRATDANRPKPVGEQARNPTYARPLVKETLKYPLFSSSYRGCCTLSSDRFEEMAGGTEIVFDDGLL